MVSFVRFQYPDEEIQQIEGDDYHVDIEYINTTQWQAVGDANILLEGDPYEKMGWYTPFVFPEKQGEISKGDITTYGGRKVGEAWRFGGQQIHITFAFNGELEIQPDKVYVPRKIYNSSRLVLTHFRERFPGDTEPSYYYGNPVFRRWHPVNGDKKTSFKIFLEKKVQFSRTEINKDLVFVRIIQGKQCPENSCVVSCGEQICCYNSEGISINSFLKEESIY